MVNVLSPFLDSSGTLFIRFVDKKKNKRISKASSHKYIKKGPEASDILHMHASVCLHRSTVSTVTFDASMG